MILTRPATRAPQIYQPVSSFLPHRIPTSAKHRRLGSVLNNDDLFSNMLLKMFQSARMSHSHKRGDPGFDGSSGGLALLQNYQDNEMAFSSSWCRARSGITPR
jgi:hypothetical protein